MVGADAGTAGPADIGGHGPARASSEYGCKAHATDGEPVHGGADASVEQLRLEEGLAAGAGFQVGAELCEGRHLADPCELTLQSASPLISVAELTRLTERPPIAVGRMPV